MILALLASSKYYLCVIYNQNEVKNEAGIKISFFHHHKTVQL